MRQDSLILVVILAICWFGLAGRFLRWLRTTKSRPDVKAFVKAVFHIWWSYMSCAAFTLLGLYVAITDKPNPWIAVSISVLALIVFLVAAFRAWQFEYRANRSGPDILLTISSNAGRAFASLSNIGHEDALGVRVDCDDERIAIESIPYEIPLVRREKSSTVELRLTDMTRQHGDTSLIKWSDIHAVMRQRGEFRIHVSFKKMDGACFKRWFRIRAFGPLDVECLPAHLDINKD